MADGVPVTPVRGAARRVLETLRNSGPLWTASVILDRVLPYSVVRLWPEKQVAPKLLADQVETILRAWGMSAEHASITARHVVYADLHGIDSHGCSMLWHYHMQRLEGSLTMTPTITVERDAETTALVNGGGGLGHVPADMAMKMAIAKCQIAGLAAVAVCNSGHYGAAGAYAAMAAEVGLIGFATTNTRTRAVVPTLGTDAMLGTNPIAFAAPAVRNRPFLLDMATSTASVGKLTMAWRHGRAIPEGWAVNAKGVALTDGRAAAVHRRLTPLGSTHEMGSHKGYGLAVAMEILSSVLPGGQGRADTTSRVGHFFLTIDPRRFRDHGEFEADLDALMDSLHASRPVDPKRPVLVAGDPEYAASATRQHTGIPLTRRVVEDIRTVARAAAAPFLLDRKTPTSGAPR